MSFPEAETSIQIVIAALGGGTAYKLADIFIRRKVFDAKAEATLSAAAMEQVDRLERGINQANALADKFRSEFEECRKTFETTRVEVTDLKIALRSLYDFMHTHMQECSLEGKKELPPIPKSILEQV